MTGSLILGDGGQKLLSLMVYKTINRCLHFNTVYSVTTVSLRLSVVKINTKKQKIKWL
jgi:hypothetical protein